MNISQDKSQNAPYQMPWQVNNRMLRIFISLSLISVVCLYRSQSFKKVFSAIYFICLSDIQNRKYDKFISPKIIRNIHLALNIIWSGVHYIIFSLGANPSHLLLVVGDRLNFIIDHRLESLDAILLIMNGSHIFTEKSTFYALEGNPGTYGFYRVSVFVHVQMMCKGS